MASGYGSRSLQGASDELHDIICGPCKTDKLDKKANHYCHDCGEYLCNSCKDVHRKIAVLKGHTILSGNQILARTTGSQRSGFVGYCSCSKNKKVEFYCEDHHDLICISCKKVKHRKCKTLHVQEKGADYTPARLNSVLTKTKSLIHEFENMQRQRKSHLKKLKRLTAECRKEIKEFRAKTDAFLDKLEQKIFEKLDEFDQEETHHIDQHISELTTVLQMLNSDKQELEDAKSKANKIIMFTVEVHVSKTLQDYEAMLAEMENVVFEPTLSFEGNKNLSDIQTEITTLGSLKGKGTSLGLSHKGGKRGNKMLLLGKKAKSQNQVCVRSWDDKEVPGITGCTFMRSGHAVLCDANNAKVKLLDNDLALSEHLKLCLGPWDVSVVDDNNAIITLPDTKELQYIQVFPHLETGRTMQLDRECRGIEVFGDEIYTAQYGGSGKGEVQVLDMNGRMKRTIQTGLIFNYPLYLAVSTSGKKIFVSDGYGDTATVTCMTSDENLVYRCTDKELMDPKSLYVDAEDNVLVCGGDCNTLHVIMANGKKYGTLLSSSDGIIRPCSIAYRETDDTLFVGCEDQDNGFSYKLV